MIENIVIDTEVITDAVLETVSAPEVTTEVVDVLGSDVLVVFPDPTPEIIEVS